MAISKRDHPVEALATTPNLELVNATPGTRPSRRQWLWFALQLLAIAALQLGDDITRGNIDPPNKQEAIRHAQEVAHLEQAHGIFVEPAFQMSIDHVHALLGLLSYGFVVQITDIIYALGQTLVPLLVALWLFLRHHSHFPLVRNITFLSTLLALAGYELYPTAPPRLTPGLIYRHHPFHFLDTVQHVIGDGKLNGIPIGYNAYSAMPSLHIAMALIVAGCLLLLTSNLLVRALAALYPFLMLFTVIVSANHYVLDAVGGALAVILATMIALVLEPGHMHLARTRVVPVAAPIPSTALHSNHTKTVSVLQKGTIMNLSPTDPFDPSLVRQRLLDLRADVLQRRERVLSAGRDMDLDPDGIALPSSERDQVLTIMFDQELREIDAALTRLVTGTYGRCARCAQAIPPRRLQALPAAALCVTCQSNADRQARHAGGRTNAA
jgi:RNA polymerase-binding transcription factor DksA/membrane-associated phospholipid phosphatase